MTLKTWNSRRWVLRFDELGQYLATKDKAKVSASAIKPRPDQAIIEAWLAQRA